MPTTARVPGAGGTPERGAAAGRKPDGRKPDGRIERGNQTRRLILRRTVDIASVEGLAGLSLGRLAGELELSKSGVFALFGSKEELQLATIRAAARIYFDHVVVPAQSEPPGIGRVLTMAESWIGYSAERVFPGGCFFHSVSAEFDARQGPVRDAIAQARREWIGFVEQTIEEARAAGELRPDTDVPQLAFEILAFLETANADSVLHDDSASYDRARAATRARLRGCATDPGLVPAAPVAPPR